MRLVEQTRFPRPRKRRLLFGVLFEAGVWYLVMTSSFGVRRFALEAYEVDRAIHFATVVRPDRVPLARDCQAAWEAMTDE
jgi:hypothetical protein